jgi:hypothetical protein
LPELANIDIENRLDGGLGWGVSGELRAMGWLLMFISWINFSFFFLVGLGLEFKALHLQMDDFSNV